MKNSQEQITGYPEFEGVPLDEINWHDALGFAHLAHVESDPEEIQLEAGRVLRNETFPRSRCLNEGQRKGWDTVEDLYLKNRAPQL